jgi:hypothetical protein
VPCIDRPPIKIQWIGFNETRIALGPTINHRRSFLTKVNRCLASNWDRPCANRRPRSLPNPSDARRRRALVTAASRRRTPRWLSRESPNLTTGAKWRARQSEAIQGLTEDRGEVRGADHGPQRPGADLPRRRRIRGHPVANSARRACGYRPRVDPKHPGPKGWLDGGYREIMPGRRVGGNGG